MFPAKRWLPFNGLHNSFEKDKGRQNGQGKKALSFYVMGLNF